MQNPNDVEGHILMEMTRSGMDDRLNEIQTSECILPLSDTTNINFNIM